MKTWFYDSYCFSKAKYLINTNTIPYMDVVAKLDRIIYKIDKGFKFNRDTPKNNVKYWKEQRRILIMNYQKM